MTVLNDLDRFHLVMDAIDRLPQTGDKGIYLKQQLAPQGHGITGFRVLQAWGPFRGARPTIPRR
jgi:hypothetical protein